MSTTQSNRGKIVKRCSENGVVILDRQELIVRSETITNHASLTTPADETLESTATPYWNPYVCGILLGLVLIASYSILGTGVGASSAPARVGAQLEQWIAPAHVAASEYFGPWGEQPLQYYLIFMFLGTFLGGMVSSVAAGRARITVERGKAFGWLPRLLIAGSGGLLTGFASRLARGCTSGQALSGGVLLSTGSLIFVACLFIGGYAAAYFVRKQWND